MVAFLPQRQRVEEDLDDAPPPPHTHTLTLMELLCSSQLTKEMTRVEESMVGTGRRFVFFAHSICASSAV